LYVGKNEVNITHYCIQLYNSICS